MPPTKTSSCIINMYRFYFVVYNDDGVEFIHATKYFPFVVHIRELSNREFRLGI
ncbi:hypothetical protein EMIT0210MI2_50059 [Priestia megaterium]